MSEALNELQKLDAVATEQGMLLGFRVCEDGEEVEAVFLKVFKTTADDGSETSLVSITDENGFMLGRYVLPRERLDAALDSAEDISDASHEPAVVPADW